MDLLALRTFLVVADERHFGRAALRLNLAQPAVSQQVKRLEKDLRVPLFVRTTRTVELTEAGRHLQRRGAALISDVQSTERELDDLRLGRAGRVAIGFVGTATYDVLPAVARRLREEFPEVELDLRGEQLSPLLMEMLLDRRIDLALVRNPHHSSDFRTVFLREEPLIAVLPPEHSPADHGAVQLRDLRRHTFITYPAGHRSAMSSAVLEACRRAGFSPRELIEVGETSTLVAFVAAGLGVALVPESVRALALAGVSYHRLSDVDVRTELVLATRNEEPSAAVRAVSDAIVRQVAGVVPSSSPTLTTQVT